MPNKKLKQLIVKYNAGKRHWQGKVIGFWLLLALCWQPCIAANAFSVGGQLAVRVAAGSDWFEKPQLQWLELPPVLQVAMSDELQTAIVARPASTSKQTEIIVSMSEWLDTESWQAIFEKIKAQVAGPDSVATQQKAGMPAAKITDTQGNSLGNFVITAYCNCPKCQGRWLGQTASGSPPTVGKTVAVDPKVIPLGSKIHIEGVGWRVAEDTGGQIKGQHIDVLMDSHEHARNWGKQMLQVWAEQK